MPDMASDPRPDPTSDLHWSEFKGPIHEIFAYNAEQHPDRPCVVETASSTSSERVRPKFTDGLCDKQLNFFVGLHIQAH